MNKRRRQRTRLMLLRIIFVFSLLALLTTVVALIVATRLGSGTAGRQAVSSSSYVGSTLSQGPAGNAVTGEAQADYAQGHITQPSYSELPDPATEAEEIVQDDKEVSYLPEDMRKSREQSGLTDDVVAQIRSQQTGLYYYSCLTEAEQVLYAELYYIMTHLETDVYVSASDAKMLEKVQNCVMNDHPEIFYISGYYSTRYTLGDTTVGFSFTGRYLYGAEEIEQRNASIERYIANCLAGAPTGDDYAKIKYIYDYIIRYTRYDLNAADNQNICSVMIGNASVCQGYAKAAQLLLNRMGIPATLVVGTVQSTTTSGAHAWNLVMSGGNWYFLDVTWGDAFFQDGDTLSEGANYDYLLTTSADIGSTHTNGSVVPMPVCNHMEDNYYVREGAYFTEVSLEKFGALVERRRAEGAQTVTLKCASDAVYQQMLYELVDQSAVFNYIQKAPGESLSFTRSDEQRSFTVWF